MMTILIEIVDGLVDTVASDTPGVAVILVERTIEGGNYVEQRLAEVSPVEIKGAADTLEEIRQASIGLHAAAESASERDRFFYTGDRRVMRMEAVEGWMRANGWEHLEDYITQVMEDAEELFRVSRRAVRA